MPSAGKATGKIQRPGPDAPGGPRVRKVCEVCEHEFWPRIVDVQRGWGKHCSSNCSSKAFRKPKVFRCVWCGRPGESSSPDTRWHPECIRAAQEKRRTRACEWCNEEFQVDAGSKRKFCSDKHATEAMRHARSAKAMIGGVEFTVDEIAEARGVSRETVRDQLQRIRREGRPDDDLLVVQRGGARNRYGSQGRVLSLNGESMNLGQWAKRIGISQVALSRRLRTMSVKEALTKPPARKAKTPTASQR